MRLICLKFRMTLMLFILDFRRGRGGRLKRQEAEEEAEEVITRAEPRDLS